ncbi:hypothetical protein MBLNU13_g06915t1 [Cladosporium sp. NU13]
MGSIDRSAWTEVQPGKWEREIDEIENFYLALDQQYAATGRHLFAIMGHISVTTEVPAGQSSDECERNLENAFREAWTRLRFDHPTLASWVEYEGKQARKFYEVVDNSSDSRALEGWLRETFLPVTTQQTGLEWCNSDPPVPKLPTLYVLKTSEAVEACEESKVIRRYLVLRALHNIIDGIGTLLLFNNLLKHASDAYSSSKPHALSWGEEYHNLSPSYRVAAALPDAITPQQLERIEKITLANADLRRGIPIMSVPFRNVQEMPGKHQRLSITVSTSQTAAILTACRNLSLSVTHAYHTAIAMAVRDTQPSESTPSLKRYISYCLINERSRCKPPYNSTAHAAAVYHSVSGAHLALDLTVPSTSSHRTPACDKADFKRLAPIVKEYYTSIRSDTSHPPLVPHYFTMATPKDPRIRDSTAENPAPLPENNSSPSVSISSMGRVDELIANKHGALRVHDPWVTGEELGTGLGAFLGTFAGELHLSAAYNETFHGKQEVEAFLARVQEIVVSVLDI